MRNHSRLLVSIVIALMIVCGGVLRAWPILLDRPLWYDEVRTWQTAHEPPIHEFFLGTIHKDHPPLSYLFVRASISLFGAENFWAMRLPSFIFGMLCIPAAFALGRTIHSMQLGLALAAFVAMDPLMINQSQQGRMYTLFVLLLLLSFHQATIAFRAEFEARTPWIALGILLGLVGWTHQLAAVVWVAFALGIAFFVFQSPLGRGLWSSTIAAVKQESLVFGIAVVVNLPPLVQLIRRLSLENQNTTPAVAVASNVFQGFASIFGPFHFAVLFLCAAAFGLGLIYRCGERSLAVTIMALAVVTLAVQFPLAQVHHQSSTRYLLPFLIAVWIGLSATIILPKRLPLQTIGIIIGVLFLGHSLQAAWNLTFAELRTDYHYGAATEFVMHHKALDEAVVFYPRYYRNFAAPYKYVYRQPDSSSFITYRSKHKPEASSLYKGSGVWAIIRSNKYLKDPQKRRDLSDSLARFAQRYKNDFTIEQVSDLPFRGPLIFHFDITGVRAWKTLAIDQSDVEFVPLQIWDDAFARDG